MEYKFVQNKVYYCLPDVLNIEKHDEVCISDILQNFKLRYKSKINLN